MNTLLDLIGEDDKFASLTMLAKWTIEDEAILAWKEDNALHSFSIIVNRGLLLMTI